MGKLSDVGKQIRPVQTLPFKKLPGYTEEPGLNLGLSMKERKPVGFGKETKIPKELEPLKKQAIEIAKKYPDNPEKGAEEFIKGLNVDKNIKKVYNRLYGQKARNKFREFEQTYKGTGLPKIAEGRTAENRWDITKTAISRLLRKIKENPEGFTIRIDGEIPTCW